MRKVPELRFDGFEGEWEENRYSTIFSKFQYGLNAPSKHFDGINKYLRITDIDDETRKFKSENITSPDEDLDKLSSYTLEDGDICFARTGATVGKTYKYRPTDGKVYFAGYLIKGSIESEYDSDFIFQSTLTKKYENYIKITSQRSGQPGVNSSELSNYKINSPNKNEQEKIGNLFRKLDALIEIQEGKVAKMRDYKKSMLQKMFPKKGELVPEFRFDGFDGDWYTKKADDMFIKNRKKNKDLAIDYVESVSNKFGFIKQTEQFEGYQLASADLSNYYVIEPYCFAYNPSRINVGSIAYKDKNGTTSVVSPLYVSFSTVSKINDYFIWYLFKTYQFEQQRQSYAEGGVRDTLSFASLSEFKFVIPTIKEQEKIGRFFKNLDTQIENEEKLLDSYKMMKKSLLQKMFV